MQSIANRVEQAESIAKSAGEAAQGAVFGGVFADRGEARVSKEERIVPLMDTGFSLRS